MPVQAEDLRLSVTNYSLASGGWQFERFRNLLPSNVVAEIHGSMSRNPRLGVDCVAWAGTTNGAFPTTSTYDLVNVNSQGRGRSVVSYMEVAWDLSLQEPVLEDCKRWAHDKSI